MKITDLRVLLHERTMPAVVGPPTTTLALLTVDTDEGISGHTFLGAPGEDVVALGSTLVRQVKPTLLGSDPLDIGRIWLTLGRRGLPPTLQGAIDVALWDIAGKAAGLPVHRLLGSTRTAVPVQTSSWVYRDPADYVDDALAYRELGVTGHKLHPLTQLRSFAGTPVAAEADIDLCRRVRDAVGDGHRLFLDAAWAYDFGEALRVGRAVQALGYEWLEDPLSADDLYGYVRLKQHLAIPLMATEITSGGLTALAPWVTQRATDFLRGDVVLKGGITGLRKIAHLAEAFHLNCELHDAYTSLNNLATLHLAASLPNCDWFEVLVINPPGEHGFSQLEYGLAEPFTLDGQGMVQVPEQPGLGMEPDWDLLTHGSADVLR
ncbi:enolase C-terminal domain-like protein [Klenkia sp. LSe6-5]|uniref:Enolase C-terminal domain-like protein n=1 Tax=Klenkia sesuvii TaxID=3103137 RepID=A0ABU8DRX5_9ACTN